MFDAATLRKTGEFLLAQKRVRLLLHKHPDGDVLGSCLGLARFLAARGVDVAVFGPFTRSVKFDYLAGFDAVEDGREEVRNPDFADTLYVVVDSTGLDRTGFEEGDFERLLRIDHHIGGSDYDQRDLVSTAYGATALLIYDLVLAMDADGIDPPLADCLYTGIMTDTGGFRYTNADAAVFRAASHLVERGAQPSAVAAYIYDRRDPAYLTLMRRALESLSFFEEDRVALLTLTPNGLSQEALALFGEDDFINLPRSLAPVEVVVQMKLAADGDWKVGFRGKGRVNVQAVATHFGGGGHFSAAGCELQGEETEIREKVIDRVLVALRDADL
jgi:bifunctional oligoribonuclease and PAP phosphatase NrnA